MLILRESYSYEVDDYRNPNIYKRHWMRLEDALKRRNEDYNRLMEQA